MSFISMKGNSMTTPEQIDYEQGYDFNPYAREKPEEFTRLTSQQIQKFVNDIKGYKWLNTDEKVSSYLADSVLELEINPAMARQVLDALNIKACDWFNEVVGDVK